MLRRVQLGLAAVIVVLAAPAVANAATYTVATTGDDDGAQPCSATNVCPTLRDAITAIGSAGAIQLAPGTYTLSNGPLTLGDGNTNLAVSIIGAATGGRTTIEQIDGKDNVLGISGTASSQVALTNLSITGGHEQAGAGQDANGGGISNGLASLTLTNVRVTGNLAIGGVPSPSGGGAQGGGIWSSGPLTLIGSFVGTNEAIGNASGGAGAGGGIYEAAALSLSGSTVVGNSAVGNGSGVGSAQGGGLFLAAGAQAAISTSTVTSNQAQAGGGAVGSGGGVYGSDASLAVNASTISSNTAQSGSGGGPAAGGGIFIQSSQGGEVFGALNSTFSGNRAIGAGRGGGLYIGSAAGSTYQLASDTIASNQATNGGDLFSTGTGAISIAGTIVAAGTGLPSTCDLQTPPGSEAANLEDVSPTHCGFTSRSDRVGVSAQLGPLRNNGGPTQTMAPGPGNGAVGRGGRCVDLQGRPLTVDQRGVTRPNPCDIGAFQTTPPAVGPASVTGVSLTTAILHATVDPGGMFIATCQFLYGPSTAYGSAVPCAQSPGSGSRTTRVSALATTLKPGTTYHFLLQVISGGGTRQSADVTFTTRPAPALTRFSVHRTTVSYNDSEPSTTTLELLGCNTFRKGKCSHYIAVGSVTHRDRSGTNRYSLRSEFRRAQLVPGHYLLKATPTIGGVQGTTVSATFQILS